jgi:hypothetical protein
VSLNQRPLEVQDDKARVGGDDHEVIPTGVVDDVNMQELNQGSSNRGESEIKGVGKGVKGMINVLGHLLGNLLIQCPIIYVG